MIFRVLAWIDYCIILQLIQYKAKKVNYIKNMIWGIDMKILKRIGIAILCIILLFTAFRIPYHIENTPKYAIYKYFKSLTNKDLETYNNVNFSNSSNENDIFITAITKINIIISF